MSVKRRIALATLAVIIALTLGILGYINYSRSHYDPGRVHPALASIKPPISGVRISYYLDGGSFHFVFTNATGRTSLVLPAPTGQHDTYNLLFVGEPSKEHPIASPEACVPIDHHSRAFLAELIQKYAAPSYNQKLALAELRGHPIDHLRLLLPK